MIRYLRALMISSLVLLTAGCSSEDQTNSSGKFKVITTFTVIADMASNVAGDAAVVQSITKPGAEIHNYQPTPRDILKAQDAKLILWNGLNLELWFEKFLANLDTVPSVVVSDGVKPMGIGDGRTAANRTPMPGCPQTPLWSMLKIFAKLL